MISIPWREALPYTDNELPGVFLTGARYREGLTQAQLSELTGIPRRHISEMENHKRPIGKQNARKLGAALKVEGRGFEGVGARRILSLYKLFNLGIKTKRIYLYYSTTHLQQSEFRI
jgi:transcriptional regulator with XRE-family HTH domain